MLYEELADKVYELGKRRGFFWPSYEVYGGVAGLYDLGPYGALLKQNIVEEWRRHFVYRFSEMIVEIESPIIAPERVFVASGHVEHFIDPVVSCTGCGRFYRADQLIEEALEVKAEGKSPQELTSLIRERGLRCPVCGGKLDEVRVFNLLFKTQIGPYQGSVGYLRPEAAQGMFISFKRVYQVMRNRLPLGIAQIGKVARNEISPRQGLIRLREFTIMEFEFFYDPKNPKIDEYLSAVVSEKLPLITAEARRRGEKKPEEIAVGEALGLGLIKSPWLAFWMYESMLFTEKLGIPRGNTLFEEKLPEERAHYSQQTFDQLVKTSRWGWIEVAGHAYRSDYDLSKHMEFSGQDLTASRALPEPVEKRVVEVKLAKHKLGKELKDRLTTLEAELRRLDPEVLLRQLQEHGYVEVAGVRLGSEDIVVDTRTERVYVERFIPHVVEPSFGAERLLYVSMEYALREKRGRAILAFPRRIAPVKVAVLPLTDDPSIVSEALRVFGMLKEAGFVATYDDAGSIGRRYARADEIGVPACVTVDYRSLEDGTVTVRDRDTWKQVRVSTRELVEALRRFIYEEARLEDLGPLHFAGEEAQVQE